MKRPSLIFGILGLLLLGGVLGGAFYFRSRPPKPNVARDVFGSPQTFDAFLNATEITAERLHYRRSERGNMGKLRSFERGAPIPLTADQVKTIQQLFSQESSYGWGFGKPCAPDYAVLFTARSDESTVRIAFCFKCSVLGVYDSVDNDADDVNSETDFVSPATPALVRLTKQVFPNDSEIQSLE